MLRNLQSALALVTCGCMAGYAAVPAGIGILITDSPAIVDGSPIRGNSTLFSGSVVEAASTPSSLRFTDGSSLVLQPGAEVQVFRDHSVLEKGVVTQSGSTRRALIVDGLTIASLSDQGAVAAALRDDSHVEAVAANGPAEVRTSFGQMVARLSPGKPLTFTIGAATAAQPQDEQKAPKPPPGPPISVRGILRIEPSGEVRITNDADGVEYIVAGDIGDTLGASVLIHGVSGGTDASNMCQNPSLKGGEAPCPIIIAQSIRRLAAGSTKEEKAPEGPAPTPAAAGASHTKVIVVTAAVAGGGALAALLALSGGKSSTPSTSAP